MEERSDSRPPAQRFAEDVMNEMVGLRTELAETRGVVRELLRIFSIVAAQPHKPGFQDLIQNVSDVVRGLRIRRRR